MNKDIVVVVDNEDYNDIVVVGNGGMILLMSSWLLVRQLTITFLHIYIISG
jgi:hypothetical protein